MYCLEDGLMVYCLEDGLMNVLCRGLSDDCIV